MHHMESTEIVVDRGPGGNLAVVFDMVTLAAFAEVLAAGNVRARSSSSSTSGSASSGPIRSREGS